MKKYRYFGLSLLFVLLPSFTAAACFFDSAANLCENGNAIDNIEIDVSQSRDKSFELFCDIDGPYNVDLVSENKALLGINPANFMDIQQQLQTVNFSVASDAASQTGSNETVVNVLMSYNNNRTQQNNDCTVKVTLKNLKSSTTSSSTASSSSHASVQYAPITSSGGGNNFFIDNTNLTPITDQVKTSGVLYTSPDSGLSIDLTQELCSSGGKYQLTLDPGSIVSLSKDNNGYKIIQLHRGNISIRLLSSSCFASKVVTNHAVFLPVYVVSQKQLRSNSDYDTDFVVSYSQDGLQGTTQISVNQGSVQASKHGDESNISLLQANSGYAENNATYSETVPRTTWVLPTDNSNVVGGATNNFIWMQYPGAAGYLFEYKFPSPSFAQDNASNYENANQVVRLNNNELILVDDLVIIPVNFPPFSDDLKQKKVETRLFAIDSNGQIISDSVASDKTTLGFE